MSEALQYQVGGCLIALLFALGVPGFLLGPFLFGDVQFQAVSDAVLWWSVAIGMLGIWLLLVCIAPESEVVEKVVAQFAGSEAVVLVLPYMLFAGTVALWRRFFKTN